MATQRRSADPILAEIRALKVIAELSDKQTRRGIRILIAVAREARGRGYECMVHRDDRLEICVRQTVSTVAVKEQYGRIPRKLTAQDRKWLEEAKADPNGLHPKPRTWERGPTGRLYVDILESHSSGHAGTWHDSEQKRVEEYVTAIVNCAENRAGSAEARAASEERAREYYRREAELDREVAIERLTQARLVEELHSQVDNWRRAQDIRAYCEHLEQRILDTSSESADSTREWIDWAKGHADAIDPLLQDPLPSSPTVKWTEADLAPYKPKRSSLFGSGSLRPPPLS
ncbi:hypothetical protein [Nonomuraea sp. KM90]|uniref:hypothetical protein n=1 Tax=Nonomuraea sp. KM90 TaxID=3457428 RepID=UPI003FCCD709